MALYKEETQGWPDNHKHVHIMITIPKFPSCIPIRFKLYESQNGHCFYCHSFVLKGFLTSDEFLASKILADKLANVNALV